MTFLKISQVKAVMSDQKDTLNKQREELFDQQASEFKRLFYKTKSAKKPWSIGTTIIIALIALAINVVLSLILAAILDSIIYPEDVYNAMSEAERNAIESRIWWSMLTLPGLVIVGAIISNKKNKNNTPERTRSAWHLHPDYAEWSRQDRALAAQIEDIDANMSALTKQSLIYIDGGAPNGTSYMGTLYINDESVARLDYSALPYEFHLPQGTYHVVIKSNEAALLDMDFTISNDRIITLDIAGFNDSNELSEDLDKFAQGQQGAVRYQYCPRSQYNTARAQTRTTRRGTVYVSQ